MRKFSLVLTMLALVLVFGLAFVACGDDSGNNSTPGGQTPGGNTPGSGAQGYLTLTDIPAAYNGKYMYYQGVGPIGTGGALGSVFGCQNFVPSYKDGIRTWTFTCIQIADGRAVLPLWLYVSLVSTVDGSVVEDSLTKYSGSEVSNGFFYIYNSPIHIENSDLTTNERYIASFSFRNSIQLTNGSATVSGDDGTFWERSP
jgi:hypothetical protein